MKGVAVILCAIAAVSTAALCPAGPAGSLDVELLLQHDVCNKFYKCVLGFPVEQTCATGLYFNSEISQCDVAEHVSCGARSMDMSLRAVADRLWWLPKPKPTTTTTARPRPTLPPKPTWPTLPPRPTWPTFRPRPTTTTTTTTEEPATEAPALEFLENGCPVDGHTHWLVAHECNCNLFYSCVWGKRVLLECPSQLHFNPTLQVCDWPSSAGCQ